MRRGLPLRVLTLLLVPALAGPTGHAGTLPTGQEVEMDDVLAVVEAFNRAFAANDVERYFSFVDDGITLFTPSNPYRVEGIEDDREEFEWSLETGRSRVGLWQGMQPHVQRFGDVAVVSSFVRGAFGPAGDETLAYWKITDVLVKRPEGWKVVHIHVSGTR